MISGILSTWNDISGLKAWAFSYERQTTLCSEMFIVDGGSSDGSLDYIKSLPEAWNVIWVEADKGNRENAISPISECRNLGIQLANFDKLVFFDSGCYYPDVYVEQVSKYLNNTEVVAVWNQAYVQNVFTQYYNEIFMPTASQFKDGFIASSRAIGLSKLSLIRNKCFYPTEFYWSGEDTYFFNKLLQRKMSMVYITEISVLWQGPKNIQELRIKHRNYAKGRVKHGMVSRSKMLLRILIILPYLFFGIFSLKYRMRSVVNWVNLEQDLMFFFRIND